MQQFYEFQQQYNTSIILGRFAFQSERNSSIGCAHVKKLAPPEIIQIKQ